MSLNFDNAALFKKNLEKVAKSEDLYIYVICKHSDSEWRYTTKPRKTGFGAVQLFTCLLCMLGLYLWPKIMLLIILLVKFSLAREFIKLLNV